MRNELDPILDAWVQSVQFTSPSATANYDNSDNTAEQNADLTDANTLYYIGCTYLFDGNQQRAVYFYRKAADKGDLRAQHLLGSCYLNGYGVDRDPVEAVRWYSTSGKQGYAPAQVSMGLCHYEGVGVPKNLDLAEKCFRLAAEQGDENGQQYLNTILEEKAKARQRRSYR